jgi:hypothetical protein
LQHQHHPSPAGQGRGCGLLLLLLLLQVGQTPSRPQQEELETAFMVASASKSPLSSVAKGFKAISDAVKRGK